MNELKEKVKDYTDAELLADLTQAILIIEHSRQFRDRLQARNFNVDYYNLPRDRELQVMEDFFEILKERLNTETFEYPCLVTHRDPNTESYYQAFNYKYAGITYKVFCISERIKEVQTND